MTVLPIELYNHILSFRPSHKVAVIIKQINDNYEMDWIEVLSSHERLVVTIGGGTRMKQYYTYRRCTNVLSFSEYYFQTLSGEYDIYHPND